jgi:transposase
MAAAYSMDLRSRVLKDADAGLSSKELAERYHVSRAWVDALKQRRRETGTVAPLLQTKFRRRALAATEMDRLAALVAARPDATLVELREALRTAAGLTTIWRALNQLDLTVKKTVYADEQRRPDVVAERRRWRAWLPLRDVWQVRLSR